MRITITRPTSAERFREKVRQARLRWEMIAMVGTGDPATADFDDIYRSRRGALNQPGQGRSDVAANLHRPAAGLQAHGDESGCRRLPVGTRDRNNIALQIS